MNRKIFILIFGFLILLNCKQKREISLADVQIGNSQHYLTLPTGIVRNHIEDYTEGIYQDFYYSDNCVVIVSTSGFGQVTLPEENRIGFYDRKEVINGIQIAYINVEAERKAEFDKAFDLMKENGIKIK